MKEAERIEKLGTEFSTFFRKEWGEFLGDFRNMSAKVSKLVKQTNLQHQEMMDMQRRILLKLDELKVKL